MIHARIDTVDHRKIIGFEVGTRKDFDIRHGGDPLWVFIDGYRVQYRSSFQNFLTHPTSYKITTSGDVQLTDEPAIVVDGVIPTPPLGYSLLIGEDGSYIKGADGRYLFAYAADYTPRQTDMCISQMVPRNLSLMVIINTSLNHTSIHHQLHLSQIPMAYHSPTLTVLQGLSNKKNKTQEEGVCPPLVSFIEYISYKA